MVWTEGFMAWHEGIFHSPGRTDEKHEKSQAGRRCGESEWPSHDKWVVRYLNQVNAVKRNKPHSGILGKWGLNEGHGHEQTWRWPAMVHHEHRDLLQRLITTLSKLLCAFIWPAYRKTAVRRWFGQDPLLCERPPDPLRDERAPWICSDELAAG